MLKRKDKILISAVELLEEQGTAGLTTKKLAEMQGVTEPALYRQFNNKQEIITCIIDEFGYFDQRIRNTITEKDINGVEAILFYVKRYCELYVSYSELTTVMFSFDLFWYLEETKVMMTDTFFDRISFLESMIEKTQLDKGNPYNFDQQELSRMINGIMVSQVYEWRFSDKSYNLEEKITTLIRKLLT